jgi:hypothetical protein
MTNKAISQGLAGTPKLNKKQNFPCKKSLLNPIVPLNDEKILS